MESVEFGVFLRAGETEGTDDFALGGISAEVVFFGFELGDGGFEALEFRGGDVYTGVERCGAAAHVLTADEVLIKDLHAAIRPSSLGGARQEIAETLQDELGVLLLEELAAAVVGAHFVVASGFTALMQRRGHCGGEREADALIFFDGDSHGGEVVF